MRSPAQAARQEGKAQTGRVQERQPDQTAEPQGLPGAFDRDDPEAPILPISRLQMAFDIDRSLVQAVHHMLSDEAPPGRLVQQVQEEAGIIGSGLEQVQPPGPYRPQALGRRGLTGASSASCSSRKWITARSLGAICRRDG